MNPRLSRRPLTVLLFIVVLAGFSARTAAQTRLAIATRRSQNAAKTIKVVTGMGEDETIPAELFKRAYAVGVFPDVVKSGFLFSQGMQGYGVISTRQGEGWTVPAYYAYGTTQVKLNLPNFKSFDLVVLFMKKDAAEWFQGGRLRLKGLKAAVAGPVGKLTREADLEISGVSIIMYALVDGKIKGINAESDFLDEAIFNPDNNINKAVYGMKGREVLLGKAQGLSTVPPEVKVFTDTLDEKLPAPR
jgi:lipid-binding SYLF domain-containing protein